MNSSKLAYKPVDVALGIAGGVLAGAAFQRVWRLLSGADDAPKAIDQNRGWGEVLAAAALHGAIFAAVRAAVDRGSAQGVRRVTGRWPA